MEGTPHPLLAEAARRVAAARPRVVLPERGRDDRVDEAARVLAARGLAALVDIPEDPTTHPEFENVAGHLHQRRRAKGLDLDRARQLARDPLWFGAGLVALGHADLSVAGAATATGDVIRAGLQMVGTAPGIPVVSSTFLMLRSDWPRPLSFADCAVVPDPDPDQLAAIARSTAANHRLLTGDEPTVAFLSFSTRGSAEHARVDKVRAALERFRALAPDIPADGELQLDAALVPSVADRKAPGSDVAGRANVLVFPDLDAGNIGYKIAQRLGGFAAIGPLIQGLAKPCLDLSRGCSTDDVVQVATLGALMAGLKS
jgi:phosphate acetyltransferase